jgi:lipoprotein-releasing system permease protein
VYFWTCKLFNLSFERFISSRLIRQKHLGLRVSRPVLRISVVSIALAILVNSLTLAIVRGFQQKIKDKITGFNAPLFISKAGSAHIFEAEALDRRIPFLAELAQIPGVNAISPVAFKPLLLQSTRFNDTIQMANGQDSLVQRQDMLGLMLKGVDPQYDWSFIRSNLVEGRLPKKQNNNEVLLSLDICKKLNIKIEDEVSAYHIKQQPLLKKLKVVGIYNTGFLEYDQKLVFGNLALVQQMSDNGTKIALRPNLKGKSTFLITVEVEGDASNLLFDWGLGKDIYTAQRFTSLIDTTIKVYAYRYSNVSSKLELIDSAQLQIDAPKELIYDDLKLENSEPVCLVDGLEEQVFATQKGPLRFRFLDGTGTAAHFISGFEVAVSNLAALPKVEQALKDAVEMRPVNQHLLQVSNIQDTEADLFSWLHFLDFNVLIIIFLMLIIGIINVGSAVLVLIVVRTSFVGLLKALGANNRSIRRIFLWQAAYLLLRGLLIGNTLAITFSWLQYQYGFIKLNPEVYYLDAVPIEFNFWNFIFINALTFSTCMVALLLPSRVVSRISPIKALKFQ